MVFTKFERILVAIDDSPCSEKVIQYAREIAFGQDISLALTTIITPVTSVNYGSDPLLGQQSIMIPDMTDIHEATSHEYLENIAQQFDDRNTIFCYVRVGNIREEILSLVQEWSADLIIIGTNGKSGFEHFLAGSISESVIRKASCPVLVIPSKCD